MIKKISLIALALMIVPAIGCLNETTGAGATGSWEDNSTIQIMPKENPSEEPVSSDPIFVDDYKEALKISKDKPLLVIFGTEWCGYCVKLKKEIKDFDLTNYVICIVDADEEKDLAKEFKVNSYPTSFILKNEIIKDKKTGYRKSEYSNWIKKNR